MTKTTSSPLLAESDVRAMIRLLGETAAIEGGHQAKKHFLMDGLCDLIGGNCWIWTLGCGMDKSEGKQIYVGVLHGGFDEGRLTRLLEAIDHPDMPRATGAFWADVFASEKHTTRPRHEIDPEQVVERGPARAAWERADIGSLIISAMPLGAGSLSGITVYRRVRDPQFTPREVQIAHIILQEVPWLHLAGWPEDRGATVPQLHPRQRIVMNLLLDGLARKQIADHMGISENTVSGYAKDVYLLFGVHSQPELMRKFLTGGTPSLRP